MNKKQNSIIIKKYINNSCNKKEFETVYNILSDSSKFNEYDDIWNELWEASLERTDKAKQPKLENEAAQLISKQSQNNIKVIRLTTRKLMQLAATLLVLVGIGWLLISELQFTSKNKFIVHEASFGELKQVELADGSVVTLGATSQISVPKSYNRRKRDLHLKGEAFFNVQKDKKNKFTVNTDKMRVTVMGTSFTIRSFNTEETSIVTVNTGKVKVDISQGRKKKAYYLTPDLQLMYNKITGNVTVTQVDSEKHKEWIDKKLYFNQTPLYQVITDLQNMYGVQIKVADKGINSYKVSGEHANRNLNEVLESICFVHSLTYRYISDNVIILERDDK